MRAPVRYIWQLKDWPHLTWRSEDLLSALGKARQVQGRLLQSVSALGWESLRVPEADTLVQEILSTSAIEGEKLDLPSVRSSVARRLGLPTAGLPHPDRRVEGMVEVLQDAVRHQDRLLTEERLKGWQAALFPGGYSGFHKVRVGEWRGDEPMRVVSGPVGREKVHFEAPPSSLLPEEMARFLSWWNEGSRSMDGLFRAGLGHFYFVTLHPFEDGNGRLARALMEMGLAQDEESPHRFYSVSDRILAVRKEYYDVLESSQKGSLDVTVWMEWFLHRFREAVETAETRLSRVLKSALFWKRFAGETLSEKQRKVLGRMLSASEGFEGGLTTRKFVKLTGASRATAFREIAGLVEKKILRPRASRGRSQAYDLNDL